MCKSFPFQWADKSIRYLGIDITPDLAHLYSHNYLSLLQRLKMDLCAWHNLTLTWFGRCNALKMTALPQVLYVLQTLPIWVPPTFFKQLQTIVRDFIWAHRSARTKIQTLTRPKEKGGIGLPDIRRYYKAVHLDRIVDWHCNKDSKQWVKMEVEHASIPLLSSPWLLSPPPEDLKAHPLIGATLTIAKRTFRSTELSPLPSPMTPVIGNPDFTPGLTSRRLRQLTVLSGRCLATRRASLCLHHL